MNEKTKQAIETMIDAKDVCENQGSAYFISITAASSVWTTSLNACGCSKIFFM